MASSKDRSPSASILSDQRAIQEATRQTLQSLQAAADMMAKAAGQSTLQTSHILDGVMTIFSQSEYAPGTSPTNGGGPNSRMTATDHAHRHGYIGQYDNTVVGGKGLAGIRSNAAERLHQRMGSTYQRITDPATGEHVGYREYHPTLGTRNRLFSNENPVDLEQEIGKRAGGLRNMAHAGISALSRGASSMGALRAVPYIGTALSVLDGGKEALEIMGGQREKNAFYQSIYGGSNASGFGQRIQGEGYKLSQLFSNGLTGQMADQAFQGVSAMGYQGQQRSSDLSFISGNYKSMGMSVADSLNLISTASKSLNENLSGLKDGLKAVSDTAAATGQSAQQARQMFSANYSAISGSNPGSASPEIASLMTRSVTGMGRAMSGTNLTGMMSTGNQTIMAANAGMSLTQWQGAIQQNPMVAARGFDQQNAAAVGQTLSPEAAAYIQKQVASMGGQEVVGKDPAKMSTIAQSLMSSGLVNAQQIMSALAARGIQVQNPTDAVIYAVNTLIGTNNNQQAQKEFVNSKMQQYNVPVGGTAKVFDPSTGKNIAGPTKTVDPVADDAKSRLKGKNIIVQTKTGQRVVSIDEAYNVYRDQLAKGTAIVADTGQTVKDALGGEAESNYTGTTTTQKDVSAPSGRSQGLDHAYGQSLDSYNKDQSKKSDAKGGTVTIQPTPELQRYFTFIGSGSGVSVEQGAAAGVPLQPGSR